MKRNGLFAVIALALGMAGMASVAQAQDTDTASTATQTAPVSTATGWYIVPRLGVVVPDHDRQVRSGPFGGIGVGFWVTPRFTLDLEGTYDEAKFKNLRPGDKWKTTSVDVAARYYFGDPSAQSRPYIMGGLGAWQHEAVSGNDGWDPGATAGVGVLYNLTQRIGLRLEVGARYYRDNDSAEALGLAGPGKPRVHGPKGYLDYLANVGLVINFGHAAPPPPPAAPPPPPPPPPVAPPPPPAQHVVIDLRGVNFKFDRPKRSEHDIGPTLKPPAADSLAILNQAVDTLNRYPDVKIQIDGYTDSVGTDAYNQGLSERRAQIVDAYLTSHGIDASRISGVKGFGETNPIDTNKTADGRQRNRRVEFKVQQPADGGGM